MTRSYIRDLGDGDSVDDVMLVRDKQVRANRNNNTYLLVELGDRTGAMTQVFKAADAETRPFEPGDLSRSRARSNCLGTNAAHHQQFPEARSGDG